VIPFQQQTYGRVQDSGRMSRSVPPRTMAESICRSWKRHGAKAPIPPQREGEGEWKKGNKGGKPVTKKEAEE